jgi:hypothetical protein
MKNNVLWNVTPYSPMKVSQHFMPPHFLFGLFFDSECGGDSFENSVDFHRTA